MSSCLKWLEKNRKIDIKEKTQWPHNFSYYMNKTYWKFKDIFFPSLFNIGEESTPKEELYG